MSRTSSRFTIAGCVAVAIIGCSSQSATPAPQPAQPAAQPAATMGGPTLPSGVTTAMVAVGDSIFHAGSCKNCHGMDGKGGARGANLTDAEWVQIGGSYPEIVQIIIAGVAKDKIKMVGAPFAMRPRGGMTPPLTDDQVNAVAAYVYTLSHH